MKKVRLCLVGLGLAVAQMCFSQSSDDDKYPNLATDLTDGRNLSYFIKHKITIPGVWGIGANAQYMMDNIVYAEAEVGYGWVIGDNSNMPDEFKKFRPWFEIRAGYPVISFTKAQKGKWVTSQRGGKDYYYQIHVPARKSLIAMAGFSSEPISLDRAYSLQTPVFKIGLKWLSYLNSDVVASDQMGNSHSGEVQRKFEVYAGFVIAAKDELISAENVLMAQKSEVLSLEFMFSIPYRLNGWATFDFGMRSLGYNDIGQIYIGNTFYL